MTLKNLKPINLNTPILKEPEFDDPNGSVWIVSVDFRGQVSILKPPNIHDGFLDFCNAEEIGIPYESNDAAGVYKWTCRFWSSRSWDVVGYDDNVEFEVTTSELLYLVN